MARTTPAQNPLGLRRIIFLVETAWEADAEWAIKEFHCNSLVWAFSWADGLVVAYLSEYRRPRPRSTAGSNIGLRAKVHSSNALGRAVNQDRMPSSRRAVSAGGVDSITQVRAPSRASTRTDPCRSLTR